MYKNNNTWKPRVSVVMCTYNGEKFLHEQIDSILAQSYPIAEFLIFDDNSSDTTSEIIESYAREYPLIQFHKNPVNLGYNLNFQQALKTAQSEVIAIADQDDMWHQHKIERMIAVWDSAAPIIHCDSQRFIHTVNKNNPNKRWYRRFKGTDTKQLFVYNTVSGHAMLLRKSFLPMILPFEKNIYYDWWVALVASCNGGVDYIDETLVYQRVHGHNASIERGVKRNNQFINYREVVSTHLKKFITAPNLKVEDKKLAAELQGCLSDLDSPKKRRKLFLLIFKNRKIIFYYKKRKVELFSHIKYALRLAFY
jgi:glycosyltransferase involved in cell wall biosynthesis